MKKNVVFTVSLVFLLVLHSCSFSGIEGNGNVIRERRNIREDFNGIQVGQGIELVLTQGAETKMRVSFDENLLPLLVTEVLDSILEVYFKENVGKRTQSSVYLTVPDLQKISASSGASVISDSGFTTSKIALNASSGAVIRMTLKSTQTGITSSSGANVILTGTTDDLTCDASSGSTVETSGLEAKQVNGTASSGAIIDVRVLDRLQAKASSGSTITYDGNPQEKSIYKSSGGTVQHKD